MVERTDAEHVSGTHNTARFFVESPAVSAVALAFLVLAGLYGYQAMPKQKDPTIPTRVAAVFTPWAGMDAETVELLVTKPIEAALAQNSAIHPPDPNSYGIQSLTIPGLSMIRVQLAEDVTDTEQEFNDMNLRLDALNLPKGAGPIVFNAGFGDTDALMLTVASPRERETSLALRAASIREGLERARAGRDGPRASALLLFPRATPTRTLSERVALPLARALETAGVGTDAQLVLGEAFVGVDAAVPGGAEALLAFVRRYAAEELKAPRFHPDAWEPFTVADLADLPARVAGVAGAKYTWRQLDDLTEVLARGLADVHEVSKVLRTGVLREEVELLYSQDELAALGIPLAKIEAALAGRNPGLAGGTLQAGGAQLVATPTGALQDVQQVADVLVTRTDGGAPVHVRDIGEVWRAYQSPPPLLHHYTSRGADGAWLRSPAITLGVQMRVGEQIADFGAAVQETLARFQDQLPEDLIVARTSDQPRQVRENIALFIRALYEAIVLVVVVALVGFWDWRSALLMMLSIPITLLMTFAFTWALGIHIQQVAIATLIIALGLLVDDPVVAGDSIKRELGEGHPRHVAAWLGPTKLATAILFATLTNIIAYLPFVMLPGATGDYLYSLPVVMACALISSRLVSMTFIPFLGMHILRAPRKDPPPIEERRRRGFTGLYYRTARLAVHHRWLALLLFVGLMLAGASLFRGLRRSFFPLDVQYLSTVDVWLPNGASVYATEGTLVEVEDIVKRVAGEARAQGRMAGELRSITSFAGGGGPRFWQTIVPELNQPNYAQLVLEVEDKDDSPVLIPMLQEAFDREVAGAWVDAKQLQTNPVEYPVAFRLSGRSTTGQLDPAKDMRTLDRLADELAAILRRAESAERVRSDWQDEQFRVSVEVDPDRASLSGLTHGDVATALRAAYDGKLVTTLEDGDRRIPVVLRMVGAERPDVDRLRDLYVYPATGGDAVPLGAVADVSLELTTGHVRRLDHFRTVTVFGHPKQGMLPSDVTNEVLDEVQAFAADLPPGYELTVSGELSKQENGFSNLLLVLAVSTAGIFVMLVLQFRNLVKPLLVLAGVPFGFAGGIVALYLMDASFSFMAFLGLVSLVGVIVSHIIIIFDFIEKRHEAGDDFENAVLDAGIVRLRPVLITVSATVLALVPLATEGGPMWAPLCYAQIGGLTVATAVSLLVVPVLFAICVEDLKILRWGPAPGRTDAS